MKWNCLFAIVALSAAIAGCSDDKKEYGVEKPLALPGSTRQVWAVAPAINLSGQKVDPILQADRVYEQLGKVAGLTPLPVNRVVEVFIALKLDQVQSEEQADLVCDLLGCDALVVPVVSIYDPYTPPKVSASLNLFRKRTGYRRPVDVDPRELARKAAASPNQALQPALSLTQVAGMFDAADGSTRAEAFKYAQGRFDPEKPYNERAYLVDMDRYCGFVYYSLINELLTKPGVKGTDARNEITQSR